MAKQVTKSLSHLILGIVVAVLIFALGMTATFVFAGKLGENGANGKSAYEIAVENGFTGTEAEWLESLKGTSGADGQNGVGTKWFTGRGLANAENTQGAKEGDFYININTNSIYTLESGKWIFVSSMTGSEAVSPWDGTIPGWQAPNLSDEEILANRPASYVVNETTKTVELHNAEAFAWFGYRALLGKVGYKDYTVKLKSDIDLADQLWIPIGGGARSNAKGKSFEGTFDGEGHTIYNLDASKFWESIKCKGVETVLDEKGQPVKKTVSGVDRILEIPQLYIPYEVNGETVEIPVIANEDGELSFGLFSTAYDATIKNLNVENVTVNLPKKEVKDADGNAVKYSSDNGDDKYYNNGANVTIIGDSTGAIVGFAHHSLTLENCTAGYEGCTGVISGVKCAGGLVGRFYGGTSDDGKKIPNAGDTWGTFTAKNCANYLSIGVNHTDKKGGIVGALGYYGSAVIENCTNYGNLVGDYSGGMVGFMGNGINPKDSTLILSGCTNYGNLEGTTTGGMISVLWESQTAFVTIRNCLNYGNVNSKTAQEDSNPNTVIAAGGIIGSLNVHTAVVTILDCFNYGNISAVRYAKSTTVSVNYFSAAGGLIGRLAVNTSSKQPCVISGGSSGTVTLELKYADAETYAGAGVCIGYVSGVAADKVDDYVKYPYGSLLSTGTATLTQPTA